MTQSTTIADKSPPPKKRRKVWRILAIVMAVLLLALVALRIALPSIVRWKVNQVLNQSPLYSGKIQDVQISLWRGAYTITGVTINQTTGSVPVPLFYARSIDLSVEWEALLHGSFVGEVFIADSELNFVDTPAQNSAQAGESGPWLKMIGELFPLKINKATIENGSARFHAFHKNPPVDVYVSQVSITIENLTNIRDETKPMVATVKANGTVMDNAKFEFLMEIDPFSYYPTFTLAFRMIGLDVTRLTDLTQAYGMFDYEQGWFDLVIELQATQGQLDGYIKPLFRNIRVLSLEKDIKEDNVLEFFWEALVGAATHLLKNQKRDQFGTKIPIYGTITSPQPLILDTIGNILRNAFIRAYLPKLTRKSRQQIGPSALSVENQIQFKPGSILEPGAGSDSP